MNEKKKEEAVVQAHEDAVLQDLRGIYEDETGSLPDLSTLEAPKRSWRSTGLKLTGLFALLALAVWSGFFFLGGISFRGTDAIDVSVVARPIDQEAETDAPLVSGTPARIAIRYRNTSQTPLAGLSVHLNLPDAFVVDRLVPEPTADDFTWDLGSLSSGSDGVIELYGTPIGAVPSTQKLQVITTYRPANFSSEFDDITLKELVLAEDALDLQVSAPETSTPGEPLTLELTLLNPTRHAISNVDMTALLPDGFHVTKSEPPIGNGFHWSLPRMEAHSKALFKVTGTMSANTRGIQDVGGTVSLLRGDDTLPQETLTRPINVLGGALATNVIINGSGKDQSVDSGSLLHISIPVENASETSMKHVELELAFEGTGSLPLLWDGAGSNLAQATKTGNRLLWNEDLLESFEELSPGQTINIDLTLPLSSSLDGVTDQFSVTATIAATPSTKNAKPLTLKTTPVIIRLNGALAVHASVLAHGSDGEVWSTGPLPPAVGQTTSYVIAWTAETDTHALDRVVMEAELPPTVQFKDVRSTSVGTLTYSVDRRVVRWEASKLDGAASAQFSVSVTPRSSDVGSFLKLLLPATLTGKDAVTGSSVRKETPALTNVLSDDPFATDDGIVVE